MTFPYSKDVLDAVLKFFTTSNFESELLNYESAHAGITIDRLTSFDTVNPMDEQTPYGVLYELNPQYEIETFSRYMSNIEYAIDFKDSRADLDQLRNNLYAYRDAVVILLNKYKDLQNNVVDSMLVAVKPPLVMHDSVNYTGIVEVVFRVKYN